MASKFKRKCRKRTKKPSQPAKRKRSTGFGGATDSNERRIVLVGKTGVGKSAAGNIILGTEAFESELSPSSQTSECQKAKGDVRGRKVAVIDTPGLFDTKLTKEEVLKRIKMCISLSAPGPHAFLVVLQLGRFTQEEKETIKMIQTTFGEDAVKYMMVLFTHGDRLKKNNKNKTIQEFVSESKDLKAVIHKCSNRYHVFNNEIEDPEQTSQLLDKIDNMTMANGGSYYTNEMFMRAEAAIEKEKQRLLKESEAQTKKELDELKAKYDREKLELEVKKMKERHQAEARAQAERLNEFVADSVRAGAVCGAVAGGVLGAGYGVEVGGALGVAAGPVGVAVGAAVGGALGAVVGVVSVVASKSCHVQ